MGDVVEALSIAETFVDAARLVCDEALRLEVKHCVVFLHAASGPPVLAIDNAPVGPEDLRQLNVGANGAWRVNPIFVRMRASLEPMWLGPKLQVFGVPAVGPTGWFATVVYTAAARALETEMVILTNQLAEWCVGRGITRVPELGMAELLIERQYRVARPVGVGYSNVEIAAELGMSIFAIEALLDQIGERLRVRSRAELARLMCQFAPLDGIPLGVSRKANVSVARDRELVAWIR